MLTVEKSPNKKRDSLKVRGLESRFRTIQFDVMK